MPPFKGVVGLISQALIHLFSNAADGVEKDGIIKTTTRLEKNRIIIEIKDNGKGIPPDQLTQIFHPFFTTKPVGSGTGLGLPMVERIVKQHKGSIDLKSRENLGTTVVIQLPL